MTKWFLNLSHTTDITVLGLAHGRPFKLAPETFGTTQRVLTTSSVFDLMRYFRLSLYFWGWMGWGAGPGSSHFSKWPWSLLVENDHLKTTVWALGCSLILDWSPTQWTELGNTFFWGGGRKAHPWWGWTSVLRHRSLLWGSCPLLSSCWYVSPKHPMNCWSFCIIH